MITTTPHAAGARSYQPVPTNPFVEFPRSAIEHTLHGRFEHLVDACPERFAVVTRTQRLTYRALNAHANRVARAIVAHGNPVEEPVALLFPQGVPSIIATLGTLKAGKFYVPLDPHVPVNGIARLLEDSHARLVVTDSHNLPLALELCGSGIDLFDVDRIDSDAPDDNLARAGSPDALAYVYYTSGSTGMPKGAMDTHRNVLHNIMRYTNRLHICAEDRLTLLQPFGFSGAVSSLFSALLNGACVFPIDLSEETPNAVAEWLAESGVTIYHSVPALFRAILAEGATLRSVRLVRLEGDQASIADVELYRKHCGADCLLVNGLGTTETGIVCQYFIDRTMQIEGRVPIGYPTDDVEIRILDEDGNPIAEAGQAGEIAVVSRYLSPGYWRNPVLTRRVFTRDLRDDRARLYRTGDLGRLRLDGCVEHLGRNDGRVKIRGQWVTLADVESALLELEDVREAVVTARVDATGDTHLIAYLVASNAEAPSVSALRRRLAADLPAHMIPSNYVMLDAFPLNHNGKIDRKALPPPQGRPRLDREYVGPESLLQQRIAQVWEDILGVHPVGIRDNFFDLGGHSLQAARMVDRLEHVFNRKIPLSILFDAADVETLADLLFQQSADLRFPLLHIQPGGSKPPFFLLHGDYLSGGFYCLELARHLGADQPFYALPPYGLDDRPVPPSYERMAAQHVETLRAFRPSGPYLLGGTCNGGMVAFEMARQLVEAGERVDLLVLIGSSAQNVRSSLMRLLRRALGGGSPGVVARLRAKVRKTRGPGSLAGDTVRQQRERLRKTYLRIDRQYIPGRYGNPITLFWPEDDPESPAEAAGWWEKVAPKVDLHVIPGTHLASLTADVKGLAVHLKRCLDRAAR